MLLTRTLPFALVTIVVAAPLLAAAPQERDEQHERARDAHSALLALIDDEDTGAASARFTESVIGNLPVGSAPAKASPNNFIDEILFSQMDERGISRAALTSDAEFMRRLSLDATGLPPEPSALIRFLADTSPDKREQLIDSLVGSPEFAEQWAWFWGDLFRLASQVGPVKNPFQFWVKEWLTVDRPYDEVVHDLIGGVSKAHGTIPALAFLARSHQAKSRIVESTEDYSIHNRLDAIDQFNVDVSRIFLGINTSCISCHDGADHLEKVNSWLTNRTREEFYRQSAFLGRTRMITTWDDRSKNVVVDLIVDDLAKGYDTGDDAPYRTLSENRFPRLEGESYEPRFILTGETPKPGENPRRALARMITSHPQFARAAVNLVWGKLMTVAFVEPYNAFDLDRIDPDDPPEPPWTIQPLNPELLEALASDFRKNGYRIHHLMKTIMGSSTYQLQAHYPSEWKDEYVGFYPRKYVRVLTGPEVVDAIATVTDSPPKFSFSGTTVHRVKQLASPSDLGARRGRGEGAEIDALMQSFFQSNRMTPAPVGNKGSTLQALLMMQSSVVNRRVLGDSNTRVARLVDSELSNEEIVEALYIATLSRPPGSGERSVGADVLMHNRRGGAENLQWALLNSPEFLLNH